MYLELCGFKSSTFKDPDALGKIVVVLATTG
jgi:hypothetical protein